MRLLLLSPRGMCPGVNRAVATVEAALERYGPPIYVLREIVHNRHVIEELAQAGARFVGALSEVPRGARVVFSAHGVDPAVRAEAASRALRSIDATCPLVTKVHRQAQRAATAGEQVVLIGERDHDEVVGTQGHAPNAIVLPPSVEEAERLRIEGDQPIRVLSQTTLATDEVDAVIAVLCRRFGGRVAAGAGVCYATRDRQRAVRQAAATDAIDRLLVVGSPSSSNSRRLVEVARGEGLEAKLIDDPQEIDQQIDQGWLDAGAGDIGLTAGASTPETIVCAVLARLGELGLELPAPEPGTKQDNQEVAFKLPTELTPGTHPTSEDGSGS